jgi:hypothetical protein
MTISAALNEALRTSSAVVLRIADRVWTIGDLLDAGLATEPAGPETRWGAGGCFG